jgi:hypothetical protein
MTLNIAATNFNKSSVAQWTPKEGAATTTLSTNLESDNALTAVVTADLLKNAGSATVTVDNGYGGKSSGVTFTITSK